MSDKKHIDDLLKEQLQNFEAAPSPQVWTNIQAQLKKEKDDRKVIPLWWKLGGVAAVIALLLTVGNLFYTPLDQNDTLVKEDVETLKDDSNTTNSEITSTKDENTHSTSEEDTQKEITPQSEIKDQLLQESHLNQEGLVSEENNVPKQNTFSKQTTIGDNIKKRDAVASEFQEKNKSKSANIRKTPFNEPIKDKVTTGITGIASDKNTNRPEDELQNPLFKDDKKADIQETGVATSNEQNSNNTNTEQINKNGNNPLIKDVTEVGVSNTINGVAENEEAIDEESKEDKPSIFDAIAEAEEKENDKEENSKDADLRSWEVTPNFGPVFYSSLDGGSSIDPMFSDNSQSTDTNFSYGVQISYAVTDRLSIRSGVSNVNLGYTTGDIDLATGPVSAALSSVDYGGRTNVLTAVDKGALATSDSANPFDDLSPKSTGGNNAQLSQNLNYYEVPLELNYALLDNRFGINMIGGFSTLFLGDSEVVANDGDFREVLGESSNLNSVSFSTNVGLGFNYKISKRLKFNIEPMFKYQLNPYSDSSVDFRPYYLGVYSGLSLKF